MHVAVATFEGEWCGVFFCVLRVNVCLLSVSSRINDSLLYYNRLAVVLRLPLLSSSGSNSDELIVIDVYTRKGNVMLEKVQGTWGCEIIDCNAWHVAFGLVGPSSTVWDMSGTCDHYGHWQYHRVFSDIV